ncbi:peptidyl-tRNA hydrolase 2 [Diutina rugosa]
MASTQSTTTVITACLISFVTGYYVKSWLMPSKSSRKSKRRSSIEASRNTGDVESVSDYEYDTESDGPDVDSRELNQVPGDVKMVLVVRQDLKMGKGKAAAQCSHATLALYKKITNPTSPAFNPEMVQRWEYGNGQAKITLQVPNQEEMDILFAQALSLGVNAYIVHDAGRTQIAAGSATVLGLGPAPKAVLDEITGSLKLY